ETSLSLLCICIALFTLYIASSLFVVRFRGSNTITISEIIANSINTANTTQPNLQIKTLFA
ncbi:hypothetical protein, partial [Adlercreutzia equolifaciens]|uniref:hypothetical protein n=1 Tax=Adlercreutzia equolifaciens TaxID=446660 RepID=UPI003AEFDD48